MSDQSFKQPARAPALAEIVIGLSAVIVAAHAQGPLSLCARDARFDGAEGLPFGPFNPRADRTFELALRNWVSSQTGFDIGYVEQLYTFGDRGRDLPRAAMSDEGRAQGERIISIGYLALAPEPSPILRSDAGWRGWYRHFPWEDWRKGRPPRIDLRLAPALAAWTKGRAALVDRMESLFALNDRPWNEERALDRYELLYEAGLVQEAHRDRGLEPRADAPVADWGEPMPSDHRRILATAIGRLRAKVKYRPVIFELLPPRFTLSHLQRVAEGVIGLRLHTQNFRRALARAGLVEGLDAVEADTGGRPAQLFRFRREAIPVASALGLATPLQRPRKENGADAS